MTDNDHDKYCSHHHNYDDDDVKAETNHVFNYFIPCKGAFSIFNTSTYSDEKIFKTPAKNQVPSDSVTSDSQNSVVIAVSLVVSIAVLAFIACGLYLLMRRRKKHKKKTSHPQFAPGLEDLIEMRTRSHSGEEPRGNRELQELGKNARLTSISL